jgi:hypothetical protein
MLHAGGDCRANRVDERRGSRHDGNFWGICKFAENPKACALHAVGFDPPIYNVWKQQEKSSGSQHFDNSEPRWVDNLLYLYTQPFDIVADPFAGGRAESQWGLAQLSLLLSK